MKKHILVLLVFLASCSQDDTVPEELYNPDEAYARERYEAILELTGCKVEDAETVEKLFVYDDSSDGKYLYGSKKKEKRELFWISKYDDRGNSLWDIVLPTPEIALDKNEIESWAYSLKELSNGNLVFFQIMGANIMAYESRVLIINPNDGGTIANIDIEHSLFTNIHLLKEGFLVYSEKRERDLSPNASDKIFYISNDGVLLNRDKEITIIPTIDDNFISDSLFINVSDSLSLMNFFGETIWGVKTKGWVDLNSFDFQVVNSKITITYYQYGIVDTTIIDINSHPYKIIKDTGVLPISTEYLVLNNIEEKYQISNGLELTLNSILITRNAEMGISYYNVDYYIVNASQESVNEGRFALLFEDKSGGIYQFGALREISPGESITRTYQFTVLEEKPVVVLAYLGLTSTIEPMYWKLPDE